jgi:hypothetical protein
MILTKSVQGSNQGLALDVASVFDAPWRAVYLLYMPKGLAVWERGAADCGTMPWQLPIEIALQPCAGAELLDPMDSIQRQEVSYGRSAKRAGWFERKKIHTKKIRGT